MSSHKKRRELNRATAEHTHARIRAELAQGIVNFENLMEHAMGVRIKELERERDAFYMDYRMKCDEEAKDSALVIIERDQLRAQINVLREALSKIHDTYFKTDEDEELCEMALASTPEQSLAEYRNKVIEAFVNEFSRHVGGDG